MPAEWENPTRILIAYPNSYTDWNYILPEAIKQYDDLVRTLADGGEKLTVIANGAEIPAETKETIEAAGGQIVEIPYNDTWTRDYGPITVFGENSEIMHLDFGFNGWGLKFASDRDNLVNLRMRGLMGGIYVNCRDFTLEGGSIETDGNGTLLTTSRCLCSDNRNGGRQKREVEEILKERLGVERVLWLDFGFLEGDDTDSHIDTLARMAPDDTIVYVAPPQNPNDIHYEELTKMEEQLKTFRTAGGKPYRLIALPFPDPVYAEDGERLPATYANYLVTGYNLYLPTYEQPENDAKAEAALKDAFPHHRIHRVDCRILTMQHGSLHCSTMQLYA